MQQNIRGTAILLCGGTGKRMGAEIPKQFLKVNDVPIIVHTMRRIENAPCIDGFVAVVHADWHSHLLNLMQQYGITKCIGVTLGGNTRLDSTRSGLEYLRTRLDGDDLVCIMDGIRPMVSPQILQSSLETARKYGAAMAADRCYDTMYGSDDGVCADRTVDRDRIFKGQTPESTTLRTALEVFESAVQAGIADIALSSAVIRSGRPVGMSYGTAKNIKITTPDDLDMFRALLNLERP